MSLHFIYYRIKPLIPRSMQIQLRRILVARKRKVCSGVWPIDPKACRPPEGWKGWPEGKKFALVLTHDVETAKGHENCRKLMELEERLGFRSSFGFVPERYNVSAELRRDLQQRGFEVTVHGLLHDGLYYRSRDVFRKRAERINYYLKNWGAIGFRSPSMHHNLEWLHDLKIEYDSSTFDTDPFEPQPDGVSTIFPFWVGKEGKSQGYLELPYTLPQDHTLFVVMQEKTIRIWKEKLNWLAEKGGMALLITHPDYMCFQGDSEHFGRYPARLYAEFLDYVNSRYQGKYWYALPSKVVRFWNHRNESAPREGKR